MTEHFTREEAFAVADASGMLDCKLADFETTLQAFANATVDAIDKKREAQGAVAYAYAYDIFTEPACAPMASWQPVIDRDLRTDKPTRNIVPLYTHALPAQPADPVNAELAEAFKAARETLQRANDQQGYSPICDTIWHTPYETLFDFMDAALSRAQAAPAVGVPDSCLWTQDTDYETDVHYSACGEAWSFIEGGPKENNVRFCQGCGKPVVIASAQPQQKEV